MRIITGKARGTKLYTLDGQSTRPTSEMAKEAIFSMLQFAIEGRCVLDLFAGSGQLGLEALSRGAEYAHFVDSSRDAIQIINKNAVKTHLEDKCRIDASDAIAAITGMRNERFDLIFIDPPYASHLVPDVLRRLLSSGCLKPTTYIICETGSDDDVLAADDELAGQFDIYRRAKYGAVHIAVLTPAVKASNGTEEAK